MSAMTSSVHAMVFHRPGEPFAACEFPLPHLKGSEVAVDVVGCTLCGSDLHSWEGRRTTPCPTVLGHEILGRIREFGPTAIPRDAAGRPLAIGDRVTWSIVASCGGCFYCLRGLPQKCERRVKYGHEALRSGGELTGGLAEVCHLAEGTAIFRVPNVLPDEVACPANCATATIAATLRTAGDVRGRRVLVLGAGLLGLTACAMSRWLDAETVVCCELSPERRERALAFGATHVVGPDELASLVGTLTDGHGVDVILELTGAPAAFESAWPLARLGGVVVLVGAVFPSRPVSLSMDDIVRRNLSVLGVHNYIPADLWEALRFLEARHADHPFRDVVSAWVRLDEVDAAFEAARSPDILRMGLRPVRAG